MTKKQKLRPDVDDALPTPPASAPPDSVTHGTPVAAAAEPTLPTTAELPLTTRIASTPAGEVALVIKGGPFGPEEKWLAWKPLEGYRVAFLILGQSAQLLGQPAPLE